MTKKILFFSSIIPEETYFNNSIGPNSIANDTLQRALMKGFQENNYKIDLINVPNIGAYPSKYKKPVINSKKIKISEAINGITIQFINLPLFKHLVIYNNLKKILKGYNLSEYDAVFMYDAYIPFFKLLPYIKQRTAAKTVAYLPDLIGHVGSPDNFIHRFFNKIALNIFSSNSRYIDVFVLISEAMKEHVNVSGKKSLVIEGMWDNSTAISSKTKNDEKKYIFYGGSLGRRHGILDLVEAFIMANFHDVDLVICGDGDTKDEIVEISEKNQQIKYLGQLPRNQILDLQANAFLLVNPRGSDGEFTKYSFPSKVFEYFTSGTPTFMYKLKGIPDEYYEYCFTSDDESVEALAENLKMINYKDAYDLNDLGKKAREFVLQNKSSKVQVSKLIRLIDN
ncbi:glycosyltransferase [Haoranjiania flava]|uniref:Glycosyltransferase n=1 Tax=Haoranjiania flava TaxID=1856322 RepID=A0AAE3IP59_9BACT|nr:glycosyltransferase [Haoranjiania flava]MCU7694611.1 glycosyltransferase [Haoranjiania flava]